MIDRRRFLGASVGLAASSWPSRARAAAAPGIVRVLEAARGDQLRVPGMIGAVVKGERVAAIGAVGIRKVGSPDLMTVEDRVHLGSCGKAMTATMIGTVVDSGKLRWDQTIGETFPDQAAKLHPDFRAVTLTQLLAHRAGLPANAAWLTLGWLSANPTVQRRSLLARMLSVAPESHPGTTFAYSNLGYVLAALMAEEATRTPWDQLMRRELFEPLGMASAGFGPPGSADKLDQPWGHRVLGDAVMAVRIDNPACMGPAGTIHCSVPDWARFASFHLRGSLAGAARLLRPETLKSLHTPAPGQDYSGGWDTVDRPWAGGPALTHGGSNTTWLATIWLAPARDFALLVAVNAGGEPAQTACQSVVEGLIPLVEAIGVSGIGPQRRRQRVKRRDQYHRLWIAISPASYRLENL